MEEMELVWLQTEGEGEGKNWIPPKSKGYEETAEAEEEHV